MEVASELTDVGVDRFVSRKEPHRVKEKGADGGTRDPVPAGGMSGLWELEEVVVTLECLERFAWNRVKWTGGNEPRLPHTESGGRGELSRRAKMSSRKSVTGNWEKKWEMNAAPVSSTDQAPKQLLLG